MKKTSKILAFILVLAILFAGCGGEKGTADSTKDPGGDKLVENPSFTDPLQFRKGTQEAYCPVCKKAVEWMGLTQAYVDTISITDNAGEIIDSAIMSETVFESGHYYLTEDLTYHDSPVMGFFRGPGKGKTSCLHLNDHNITTPATTCIFGNSGVLNVMGNGIVTGYSPNQTEGAAVRNGNRNANNGVNLYGGTYKKTDQTLPNGPVVAFDGAGRCVSVYEGVVIDGGDGIAVFAESSAKREKEGCLELIGCTVIGDVKIANLDMYPNIITVKDAQIKGSFTVPAGHTMTLSGKVQISQLVLGEDMRLNAKELGAESQIGIDATGIFTAKLESAADYLAYFTPTGSNRKITVAEDMLQCN